MRVDTSTPKRLFASIGSMARAMRHGERGSSLMAVIGIGAVTAIVGISVGAMTIGALTYTNANRSSVQARAAAEAGVAAALVGLQTTGDCTTKAGVYSSATDPVYSAAVEYKTTGGWIAGCPVAASTGIRIESTGTAKSPAGASDTHTLEAVYDWIPATAGTPAIPGTPATGSIVATGSAVYSYSSTGQTTLNNVNLWTNVSGKTADIIIRTGGKLTCQSGTQINGSVVIQNGSLEVNTCIILGGVKASGFVAVNSGGAKVNGDVVASGLGGANNLFNGQGIAAQVGAGATVGGNIIANGKVYIDGAVKGSISSAGLLSLLDPSTITPNARIDGNVTTAGSITTWAQPCGGIWLLNNLLCGLTQGGIVKGTINILSSAPIAPPAPSVPDWTNFSYNKADWTNLGFTEVVIPSNQCTIDNNPNNQVWINQVMASTTPVVVNAMACSELLFSSSAALQLKTRADVAFFSKSFGLENLTIDSATSAQHKMWFIVPGVKPLLPIVCLSVNGEIDINSGVKVKAGISAMLFTPNCIQNSSTEWRGQLYAGTTNFGQNISIEYVPIGLPGVNLETATTVVTPGTPGTPGTPATPGTPGGLGPQVSLRDLEV